jgi:hypothetical protein
MGDIDTTKIGTAAASLMEKLAEEYPDGSVVRDVMVLVEVQMPDEDGQIDELHGTSVVDWWCSEARRIYQAGLLHIGTEVVLAGWENDPDTDTE